MTTTTVLNDTIETRLTAYRFDLSKPEQKAEWKALKKTLRATPGRGHCFGPVWNDWSPTKWRSSSATLETRHLFENQWNGTKARLFDWVQYCYPNKDIIDGYYLDITDEMRSIRANTAKCGHCGRQEVSGAFAFCPHCLGSEYLKETELKLTRMRPIDTPFDAAFVKLTAEERADLIPRWEAAQGYGLLERAKLEAATLRKNLKRDLQRDIEKAVVDKAGAKTKYNGLTWLLDNSVKFPIGNVIFYTHTQRFGFGWRSGVTPDEYDELVTVLCEFPYDYDIKRNA